MYQKQLAETLPQTLLGELTALSQLYFWGFLAVVKGRKRNEGRKVQRKTWVGPQTLAV